MFSLIKLPYALDALEPVISAKTLEFHHGKHLQAYVDNLNNLLPGKRLEDVTLESVIRNSLGALFNNAGQVFNHEMYFMQFKPVSEASKAPTGKLAAQIEKQWGSLDAFKADFEAKGVGLFGSGWVWLQADVNGELSIGQYANADNPVAHGLKPIMTFDVWEHAYYLDYQNRRAVHLHELWKLVDWNVLQQRYR